MVRGMAAIHVRLQADALPGFMMADVEMLLPHAVVYALLPQPELRDGEQGCSGMPRVAMLPVMQPSPAPDAGCILSCLSVCLRGAFWGCCIQDRPDASTPCALCRFRADVAQPSEAEDRCAGPCLQVLLAGESSWMEWCSHADMHRLH